MVLKLYNTLSGEKEIFVPLRDKFAGMYSCGPTVYGFAHIGNLRAYVSQICSGAILDSKAIRSDRS